MKLNITLVLIGISTLFSCRHDSSTTTPDLVNITGITYRDIDGVPGSIDTDDWSTESNWPNFITSKFAFVDTLDYTFNNDSAVMSSLIAYPNPCGNQMVLDLNATKSTIMKYIIVDANVKIYSQGTVRLNAANNSIAIDLSGSAYVSNTLYRMYYAFLDKSRNIYLKGHGDIKKN